MSGYLTLVATIFAQTTERAARDQWRTVADQLRERFPKIRVKVYDAGANEVLAAVARDNLASQEETAQIVDWRQQAGLVSVLELDQARAAAAQTRAQLPALRTRIAQGRHALALLAGLPPAGAAVAGAPDGIDDDANAAVPRAPAGLVMDIPAETLRQRAGVRAAEYQVAAALARVGQARAQRWPSFAIGGSVGLNALTLGALGQGAAVVSSLLGSVTLPLFDGGARRAQVDVQQALLDQARQAHRAAVLAALGEVEDARAAIQGDTRRLADLGVAAAAARRLTVIFAEEFYHLLKFNPMVQTDISQLTKECNQWRERLHSLRDEFNKLKHELQNVASKALSKDQLTSLEHYQNQLHIQLINIHDLKQAVKTHDKKIQYEVSENQGQITDDTYAEHEHLYNEYHSLQNMLDELRTDFYQYIRSIVTPNYN